MGRLIRNFIYYLFHTRLFYSAFFCLRHLPLHQAIRVPIIFYPHTSMKCKGTIKITSDHVKGGMIEFGFMNYNFVHGGVKTLLLNEGKIVFHGVDIRIMAGGNLHVTESGVFDVGAKVIIAPLVRIYCCKGITIGEGTRIAHECQLFDTGFHYIEDTTNGEISSISHSINIGDWCWIGNRTTINKGVILPRATIVASGSLLNKDYSIMIQTESLIGGSPAKLIKEHCRRVWDPSRESELYKVLDDVKG